MKTTFFLFLLISFFFVSCNKPSVLPHEGVWKLVYSKTVSEDTLKFEFPGKVTGSDLKVWTKNHFIFVGIFNIDTTTVNSYGGGTYTLDGNLYEETILYHTYSDVVGKKVRMLLDIKNDTLYQKWPVTEVGKVDENNYRIEKYIRAE